MTEGAAKIAVPSVIFVPLFKIDTMNRQMYFV